MPNRAAAPEKGTSPPADPATLQGYRVLLTGASGGIGRAIALALAARGAHLALSGRNEQVLTELAKQITASGFSLSSPAAIVPADLADPTQAAELPMRCARALGGIDCVINNGGIARQQDLEHTSLEDWELMMAVNARAPFLICREALQYLRQSSKPRVINVSSVTGHSAYAGQSAYSASKHAMEGWSSAFAKEVHGQGIGVHIIAPGGVNTPMVGHMRPDIDAERLMAPEEIAEIVVFLLTRAGSGFIDRVDIRRSGKQPS